MRTRGREWETVIEVQYALVRNAVWKGDSISNSGPAVLNDV